MSTTEPLNYSLLVWLLVAIVGLVVLIARFKLHAFIALLLASLGFGICAGMPLNTIIKSFQDGLGAMLASIGMVVGLGAVLGNLLAESGGAQAVANRFITLFGVARLPWTLLFTAFLIGLPVFFAVGLVLLVPILFTLVRQTGSPLLSLAIPLVAGLSVAHGLVPPHPGPMAAIGLLKADAGKTILYSILVGLPTAVIAGPLFARWITPRVPVTEPAPVAVDAPPLMSQAISRTQPGVALTMFTLLLPVLLMLLATAADLTLPPISVTRVWCDVLGTPLMAMTVAAMFAFCSFGFARGFNSAQLLKFTEQSLLPTATVLFVVGAGGGFNRVIVASGVADSLTALAKSTNLSPLLLGWLIAALIRVATGSATVAITTAAGLLGPILAASPGVSKELAVIAMGAGSLIFSHVNDGGFWLVKEYIGLTVPQTLKTWTVMETLIAVIALCFTLLVAAVS